MNYNLINNNNLLFIVVVAFSLILRVITIGNYETWIDEKLSVSEANGIFNYNFQPGTIFTKNIISKHNTLTNVISSTIQGDGGNGILYIVCLHYWSNLFGNTDFAVRFLSLIMGVFSIMIVYFLSLEMFGNNKLSIYIMALISIHPQLISCSQEARPYAFALFFTLSSSLILLRLLNKNIFSNKYLILYMLLVAAAILSHYSTIYIFVSHFFILIFLFKINFKQWVKLFAFASIPISIVLFWMINGGFEGLNLLASRNQNYSELSILDTSTSFYMKTGLYSICAGWFQNLLTFSGNTFVNLGFRLLLISPLITIPFFLIINGLKKIYKNQRIYVLVLFILSFSSLIYATLLSLISGHIISFQQIYSIFSSPYFVILIGISIFQIRNSEPSKIQNLLNTLIYLQIIIMVFSTITIYFAFDSHTKNVNNYEFLTNNINSIYSSKNNDFIITYREKGTAMEINKYLPEKLGHIKQVIDTSEISPTLSLFFTKSQERIVILE